MILYGTKENPHKRENTNNEEINEAEFSLHGSIASSFSNYSSDQRNRKFKTSTIGKQQASWLTQSNNYFVNPISKSNHVIDSKNAKPTPKKQQVTSTHAASKAANPYLIVAVDANQHDDEEYNDVDDEEEDEELDTSDDDNNNINNEEDEEINRNNNNNYDDQLTDTNRNVHIHDSLPSKSLLSDNQISQSRSSLEYLASRASSLLNLNYTKLFFLNLFLIKLACIYFNDIFYDY